MEEKALKGNSLSSSKKYKILHIIPSLVRGGAETLLLSIARGLSGIDSPFEIRILTLMERGLLASEFERAGITVDCIDNPSAKFSVNFRRTLRYIRDYRPTIVHTHLWMGDRCGLTAAWVAGVRHRISTLHSFEMGLTKKQLLWNWVCGRLASGLIAVSKTVKELWTTRRHFQGAKIAVIYNSSGFSIPGKLVVPRTCSPRPRLLSLGRISQEKGQICTVQALPRLLRSFPRLTFDIYGPVNYGDRYRQQIDEYINRMGLHKAVIFRGPTNDPMSVYPRYDILMALSEWEGFNMAAIEAMSCGVPVIASDIPVHREIFGDGAWALLVDARDEEAVAAAVKLLLTDKKRYRHYSREGKARSADFSREMMIKSYHDYYSELCR